MRFDLIDSAKLRIVTLVPGTPNYAQYFYLFTLHHSSQVYTVARFPLLSIRQIFQIDRFIMYFT